jgi:hypothetical protein
MGHVRIRDWDNMHRELDSPMDRTTPDKLSIASQCADADIDTLVERLSVNWARPVPGSRSAGGHIIQRLARGREHAVTVEIRRSRRR